MKLVLFALALVSFNLFSYAQTVSPIEGTDSTQQEEEFPFVDIAPEFEGGMFGFYKFIGQNLIYPAAARRERVEGKVFVQFIIEANGEIRKDEVRIVTGIHEACDAEVIRVIKKCPKWKPAYSNSLKKHVPAKMVIPIAFKIGGGSE